MQSHPFFEGIDWEHLYSLTPPFRPSVSHQLDTQNFEHYDEDPAAASGGRNSRKADPHFVGYTYKNWEVTAAQRQPGEGSNPGVHTRVLSSHVGAQYSECD